MILNGTDTIPQWHKPKQYQQLLNKLQETSKFCYRVIKNTIQQVG